MQIKTWVFLLSLAASLGGGLGLGVIVSRPSAPELAKCPPAAVSGEDDKTFRHAPLNNTERDKEF